MDKTIIYQIYETAADLLAFDDAQVSDDKASLTGVAKTIIRAEDFEDNLGGSNDMPMTAYGGHNVGNPILDDYFWDFPSADFCNMHIARMEVVVNANYPLTLSQQIRIYPRNQASSYIQLDLKAANYDSLNIRVSGTNSPLAYDYNKPPRDIWRLWDWTVIDKYFINSSIRNSSNINKNDYHHVYEPQTGSGKGAISFLFWTQGEAYVRSPGREYEDTSNPGIIQLWPFKSGYVLPKNSIENYIEITAEIAAAYIAGNAEILVPLKTNNIRHLCSGTLDGSRSETNPLILNLGVNENFSPEDGVAFGGFMTFPDYPDITPKRVYGGSGTTIYLVENLESGDIFDGMRYDIWIPSIIPVFAVYPINESTPAIYPLPYSLDLCDINNYDDSLFLEDNKFVIGVYFNNYPDAEFPEECNMITITSDPCFCNCCRTVAERTEVTHPAGLEKARDVGQEVKDKVDEGCDSIFEFHNA